VVRQQEPGVPLDRRAVLRLAGQGSLALAVGAVAAACSSSGSPTGDEGGETTAASTAPAGGSSSTSAPSSAAATGGPSSTSGGAGSSVLPTYIKYEGVKPDVPAANDAAIDGFTAYPDPPIDAYPDKPGTGGSFSIMDQLGSFTPLPLAKNQWWQYLNDQLGITMNLAEYPEYTQKFTTMVAGGDLPDLVRIPTDAANLDKVLAAKFQDITEFLAGDAAKDYPMLANYPTGTWKNAVIDGKIWGIPMPLNLINSRLEANTDIVDKMGLSIDVTTSDDFLELCKGLTDEKKQQWAMIQPTAVFMQQMNGVPNQWDVKDGKFTRDLETDQYKDWLDYVKKMWDAGYFYPDSLAKPNTVQLFHSRRFVLFQVGGAGMAHAMANYVAEDPDLKVGQIAPPKVDGSGLAPVYLGPGFFKYTAFNKNLSKDRVKQLLKVLNWMASPFGTSEWLDIVFGKKGVDYTWESGKGPVATKQAASDHIQTDHIPGSPYVMFSAEYPDVVRSECAYAAKVGGTALPYPTVGLYSATDSAKGASLNKTITDTVNDVISGRKPLSDWDAVANSWRSGGGDKIRQEYEEAYARSQ
jgi:putative aldouronate transport system substrate-binding protein